MSSKVGRRAALRAAQRERTATQGGIEVAAVGGRVHVTFSGIGCPECGEAIVTTTPLDPDTAEALAASLTRNAALARQGGDA